MTTAYVKDGDHVQATGGWAKLSAELTQAVEWPAGRRDIVVSVAPGAGRGSKACFSPDRAWIEIDAKATGLTEAEAGKLRPGWRWDDRDVIAGAWGLLTHEAAHAAHTKWTAKVIPEVIRQSKRGMAGQKYLRYFEAAKLLEEPRIERRQARKRWWDTRWLRMSATEHLMADIDGDGLTDRALAARVYTLIYGRVKGGILDDKEADALLTQAKAVLDADSSTSRQLEAIIDRALLTDDRDAELMMSLGEQWVDVVGSDAVTESQMQQTIMILLSDPEEGGDGEGGGSGESGEQDGSGDGDGEQADEAAASASAASGSGDGDGDGEASTPQKKDRKSPAAQGLEKALSDLITEILKDGGTMAIGWTGRRADFKPTWQNVEPGQKVAAAALARRLREWFLPERTTTRFDTAQPPGRLNVREVMRGDAAKWAGQPADVRPWRSVSRKMVQTPPLRVGIAVDVSGSMSSIAPHSRELAYRLSTAFAALPDSRVRTVMAGEGIAAWETRPGKIPYFAYSHGEQNIHLAVEDLADRLQMYRRGNARLLIIISDGGFNTTESTRTREQVAHLIRSGCRVLWLDFDSGYRYHYGDEGSDGRPAVIEGLKGVDYVLLEGSPDDAVKLAEGKLVEIMTAGMRAA